MGHHHIRDNTSHNNFQEKIYKEQQIVKVQSICSFWFSLNHSGQVEIF